MTFWIPESQINPALWISLAWILPFGFNFFNVRRYGEIEYWLAVTKVTAFVGIFILGILLPMGVSTATRLDGTNLITHETIPCVDPATDNCVSPPGFICFVLSVDNANWQTGAKLASSYSSLKGQPVDSQGSGHAFVKPHSLIQELKLSESLPTKPRRPAEPFRLRFEESVCDFLSTTSAQPLFWASICLRTILS